MPVALLFWSNPLWKFLKETHRVTTWGPGNHETLALLWPPSLNPLPSPAVTRLVPLPHVQQSASTTVLLVCHKSQPSSALSQERQPRKTMLRPTQVPLSGNDLAAKPSAFSPVVSRF